MDRIVRFSIDGTSYELDESSLTFGEGRAIEKVAGQPITVVAAAAQKGSLEAVQAFVWVAMKRQQPTLKFSDLDEMPVSNVQFDDVVGDAAEEPDPTSGGAA